MAGTYAAGLHQSERRTLDVLGVLLLTAGPLALVARRRHPVGVLAVAFATTLVYAAADYPGGPIWFALIVAFFTALTTGHRVAALASIAAGYPLFLWLDAVLGRGPAPSLGAVVGNAAWMLVLVGGAEIVRVRRAYVRPGQHRAASARRAPAAGPPGAGRHQAGQQRRPWRAAFRVEHLAAGRRGSSAQSRAEPCSPRRAHIPGRAGGLVVETLVEGTAGPLPVSVELAAFRICQEAVTNVVRHAGAATARIRLTYGENELLVQIDDDGPGTATERIGDDASACSNDLGGSGLTGMRERTTALGGRLEAGPRRGGGFRVRATLPLEGSA